MLARPWTQPAKQIPGPSGSTLEKDGFLLKFLYWPFHLAWGINPGIKKSINNCVSCTLAYKDKILGKSVIHSKADHLLRLTRVLSRDEVVSLIISTKVKDILHTTFSYWITLIVEITALIVDKSNVSAVPLGKLPWVTKRDFHSLLRAM